MVGRQVVRDEVPRVDAFETADTWIGPQPPVHLVVADVERHHVGRAAPQQDVREATGRGPDIEGLAPLDGDVEGVEGMDELEGAPSDVGVIGLAHLHVGVLADEVTRLGRRRRPRQADVSGEDQGTCPFARRGEPALHEQHVEPHAGRTRVGHWRRVSVQSRMAGRWPESPAVASAA